MAPGLEVHPPVKRFGFGESCPADALRELGCRHLSI